MRKLLWAVLPVITCLFGAPVTGAAQPSPMGGHNDRGCGANFFRGADGRCYHKRGHYGPPPGYHHYNRGRPIVRPPEG